LYIPLLGSLSRVTTDSLETSKANWSDTNSLKFCRFSQIEDSDSREFKNLILLFGGLRHGKASVEALRECDIESQTIGDALHDITSTVNALKQNTTWRVTIICSRRTPKVCIVNFRALSKANASIQLWTMEDRSPNPYEASLAFGDVFVVTSDSVSMTCDACSTGKPVFTINFASTPKRPFLRYLFPNKLDFFHSQMQRNGYTKTFAVGQLKECLINIERNNESSSKLRDADEAARALLSSPTFAKCL